MTSLRRLYRLRIRSRLVVKNTFIALNIVYLNNKYMIQLLVSIDMAYITITRPVIKKQAEITAVQAAVQAEITKTGRVHSG